MIETTHGFPVSAASSLPTVTAAARLGEVHLLVAGSGVGAVAAAAA